MRGAAIQLLLVILLVVTGGGCVVVDASLSGAERRKVLRKLVRPRPERPPARGNPVLLDERAAVLGQFLFFSPGFTFVDPAEPGARAVSCATCHDPARAFTDGRARSVGTLPGHTTRRNAPSLYDAAFREFLFWDGRAMALSAQAASPLEDPMEMGSNRLRIAHTLWKDPSLRAAYEAVFGELPDLGDVNRFPSDAMPAPAGLVPAFDPVVDRRLRRWYGAWRTMTAKDKAAATRVLRNTGQAIGAYVARLRSGEAPVDRFLADVERGVTSTELGTRAHRGLELFIRTHGGCAKCHAGRDFTDDRFHYTGIPGPGGANAGRHEGAATLLGNPLDCAGDRQRCDDDDALRSARRDARRFRTVGEVRTPSLRNVALTAPYMHDGSLGTLRDVLTFYRDLPEPDFRGGRRNRPHDWWHLTRLTRSRHDADELRSLEAFLRALTTAPACEALLHAPATPSGPVNCSMP